MDQRSSKQSIAVVGVACYYPGASNTRELWENILARRVQFRRMLDQRLPISEYYDEDPKAPEKTYGTKAAFIENFFFDWMKHRIPKKVFKSTDIVHWLALDTALRTFEDAGFQLNDIPLQNTGVIVGNTLTGEQTRSQSLRLRWPYVQKVLSATLSNAGMGVEEISRLAVDMEKVYKSAFYPITEDSLAGGLANTIAGRICNFLNFKGGGYIVDGACSSSLLAVATAANALKAGDMDLALAGGVDVSLDPFELVGFSKARALAKDQMRVYDQRASGFVPGEGCGFILLKRLEDAQRDKNYIYALIKGWGISSDGKGGIMEPSVSGQALAIERAYKDLDYKACDIDFVEGHGTGTTKGDRVELEGIAAAVDNALAGKERYERTCGITSFKSIVGHTKAAAGVGGLIKAIMAVNQRILPPTANCTEPNDVFTDKAKTLYPLIQGKILPHNKVLRAGISSAGFGGINCHITIESKDAPKEALKPSIDERAMLVSNQATEVFVFASRTTGHLKKVIERFKVDLRHVSIAEMADLSVLLNKKVKGRLPIKAAIVTNSPENFYEALIKLEAEIDQGELKAGEIRRIASNDPGTSIVLSHAVKKTRIGFLYPGQGTQRLNMTRRLVERFPWARDLLELSTLSLYDRVYQTADKALTKEDQKDFEKKLADTKITQPAVVVNSLIWTEFLSKMGIEPQCAAGHSLGELTAFYKAGAFDPVALVKFAEFRGGLMAQEGAAAGGMVVLACSKSKAESLAGKIGGNVVLANINSPLQVVVSGGKEEMQKVLALAQQEGLQARVLNVSNAFHSSFMKGAADRIRTCTLLPQAYKKNLLKVFSCMDGEAVNDVPSLREYFAKQVVSPVHFIDLVRSMSKECDVLIEVGHGRVLTDLVGAINKDQGPVCLPVESSVGNDGDMNRVLAELFVRNVPVRWEELYANRLIRTFVPASRKKFITNQCERPLKIGEQVLKAEALDMKGAELLVDDGKSDDSPLLQVDDKDVVAKILVDLTHKLTGFDPATITLESRLLDDLNLDSIKAAELIGQAAKALGLAGRIDPSLISNNTIGQIRDRLHELFQSSAAGGAGAADNVLKRYHDKTWVRNFVADLREQEIVFKNINQLKDIKNVVFLSPKGEERLASEIGQGLKDAVIRKISFGESAAFKGSTEKIDCLVVVLPRGVERLPLEANLRPIMERMHEMVQLAGSSQMAERSMVALVQFGGGYFGEKGPINDIAACSAKALVSTLALERPELKVRVIDVDLQASDEKLAHKIIDELSTDERFTAVGYDARMTRRVVHYRKSEPLAYPTRGIAWSPKDVVVVTGGGKGITAACALEFAQKTKARMVLLGRSPAPTDMKDEANEIVQTLKAYARKKLNCYYYQCDVTNEADIKKVLGDVQGKFGKVTGVIHGAGLNSLKRLKQMPVDEALRESLPKVMGAVNVCKALAHEPPKLIVAITSIIGVTGMEGSGWYGLANELLNLHLHQFRVEHPQTQVAAIAYSVWGEIGMGAKLGSVEKLSEHGIGAIPAKEGVSRFAWLVEHDPGVQQVIVAARLAGLDTWNTEPVKIMPLRFLENVQYFMPGVELIAQAKLNVQDDLYLLDHNWRGSLLFPFVFGFEAMAQAVAQLVGVEKFDHLKAKDINLERPIAVSQEDGTTIEIHAQVLDKESMGASPKVKVTIYSQETAFQQPHFSAVFELDPSPDKSKKASVDQKKAKKELDLDVATDIYGPILFQGKMFQCIDKIHDLYYDEKTKKGECLFTSIYNKSAGDFLKANKRFNGRFLTGDPFFIDSMLQSMQVIIPQDLSLPRKIEEIKIFRVDLRNKHEKDIARSHIHKISNEQGIGNTTACIGGQVVLEIKNCDLKILQTIPERPTANDFVDPSGRDQKLLQEKLESLAGEVGFSLPVVKCLYDDKLKDASKELRHKIELPLMKKAVELFLRRQKKPVKNIKVKWLKTGKPIVEGKGIKDIGVSVSHSGSFLTVIVGYGAQGCDVESIQARAKDAWLGVLGKEKFKFLKQLAHDEVGQNEAGTVIWCLVEATKKFSSSNKVDFLDVHKNTDHFISRNKQLPEGVSALAFMVKLTRGGKKVCSLVVNCMDTSRALGSSTIVKDPASALSRKLGYDESAYKMRVESVGPGGGPAYVKRFPVTFKNTQRSGRGVYFTNYFDWMGTIREYGLQPVMKHIFKYMASNQWGIATNFVKLDIFGDLYADDVVEARFWMTPLYGKNDASFNLMFEWSRVTAPGETKKIAVSEQKLTWIKIVGHGEALVGVMPAEIKSFLGSIASKKNGDHYKRILNEKDVGRPIDVSVKGGSKDLFLSEQVFHTSLEDSNLVGNIYFSNYGKWLGRVNDLFFHKLMAGTPNLDPHEEFHCLSCDIEHVREAMPYDSVLVKMFLSKLYEQGLEVSFKFYVLDDKGSPRFIATAKQMLAWVSMKDPGTPVYRRLPEAIKMYLKERITS